MIFLFLTFFLSAKSFGVSFLPPQCQKSTQAIFTDEHLFELNIFSDFQKLNQLNLEKKSRISPMVLSYFDDVQGLAGLISGELRAKGLSRSKYCNWTPFSIYFDQSSRNHSLSEVSTCEKPVFINDDNLGKEYLKFLSASTEKKPSSLNRSILKNLGKSIRLVTHCELDSLIMANFTEPRSVSRALIFEHALYKILNTLNLPIMKTRLIKVNYTDFKSNYKKSQYAFFRESPSDVNKRCPTKAYVKGKDQGVPESIYIFNFLNAFIGNYDAVAGQHNSKNFTMLNEKFFFSPYDFDRAWVITKNTGYSNNPNNDTESFQKKLDFIFFKSVYANKVTKRKILALMIMIKHKKPRLFKIIDELPLLQSESNEFAKWLKSKTDVIDKFLKKFKANDQAGYELISQQLALEKVLE